MTSAPGVYTAPFAITASSNTTTAANNNNNNNVRDLGQLALYAAAEHGRSAVIRLLLDKWRISVNASSSSNVVDDDDDDDDDDNDGDDDAKAAEKKVSPLYVAAYFNHLDTVMTLVERGADLQCKVGPDASTCLHAATARRHHNVVNYLILASARLDVPNVAGFTALRIALDSGDHNMFLVVERAQIARLQTPELIFCVSQALRVMPLDLVMLIVSYLTGQRCLNTLRAQGLLTGFKSLERKTKKTKP
jgi:ankyrin repeat protein